MQARHDPSARRFVITEPDGEAVMDYAEEGRGIVVLHTFVPPAWRGRGVARQLFDALLAWADAERRPVASRCSYATAELARRGRAENRPGESV